MIEEDDLKPLVVNTNDEYIALCQYFKFNDDKKITSTRFTFNWFMNARFPKTLSCTKGFATCCELINKFIFGFYNFADGFKQQINEMDDLLKKVCFFNSNDTSPSTTCLLVPWIAVSFKEYLMPISKKLFKLSWTSNTLKRHARNSNKYFPKTSMYKIFVLTIRNSHKGSTVNLQAREILQMSVKTSEKTIVAIVNTSVIKQLTTSTFNW